MITGLSHGKTMYMHPVLVRCHAARGCAHGDDIDVMAVLCILARDLVRNGGGPAAVGWELVVEVQYAYRNTTVQLCTTMF
jgi:hypothetical protein